VRALEISSFENVLIASPSGAPISISPMVLTVMTLDQWIPSGIWLETIGREANQFSGNMRHPEFNINGVPLD
jgi:hypothetical protein